MLTLNSVLYNFNLSQWINNCMSQIHGIDLLVCFKLLPPAFLRELRKPLIGASPAPSHRKTSTKTKCTFDVENALIRWKNRREKPKVVSLFPNRYLNSGNPSTHNYRARQLQKGRCFNNSALRYILDQRPLKKSNDNIKQNFVTATTSSISRTKEY